MSALEFLSPALARPDAGADPIYRSPLERALAAAPDVDVRDVSALGKIEVRGDVDAIDAPVEVVAITPRRALVLCGPRDTPALLSRLAGRFRSVVDVSAALAGLEVRGEQLLRRLTDLDLDRLPAAGKLAEVPAVVTRDGDRFRVFFPQEYADYVAEVVLDAARPLA